MGNTLSVRELIEYIQISKVLKEANNNYATGSGFCKSPKVLGLIISDVLRAGGEINYQKKSYVLLFTLVFSQDYIESGTLKTIRRTITSIARSPQIVCTLTEGGYIHINFWGDRKLASASIYKCNNGEWYYAFNTVYLWSGLLSRTVKNKLRGFNLIVEMSWLGPLVDSFGWYVGLHKDIILHYRPDDNEKLIIRISGSIVFNQRVPRDQFERTVSLFKQNCFEKTINGPALSK
jgi:hypothetical protein